MSKAPGSAKEKKDELALILCGTEATDNHLADSDGNFANISTIRELAPLDWGVLEFLDDKVSISNTQGDVVDAIIIAVDHLIEECKSRKRVSEKRVLLVSNLCGPVDNTQLQKIIGKLRAADIQLSLIGCGLGTQDEGVPSPDANGSGPSNEEPSHHTDNLKLALDAVRKIWGELNGESYTFDEAIPALGLFETRAIAQRGWKVNFQIGDSLSLPVEGYTQVKETHPPTLKLLYAADPATPVKVITTYHAQDENATELDSSSVIRGYRYGATLVPFTEQDMAAVKPNAEKCLTLIGFTKAANVPRTLYVGDSVLVFVASSSKVDEEDEHAEPAVVGLAALAQALYELDGVALVRRVYNRICAPRLGVLTPEIRGTQVSLVYTDLAFAEDVRNFVFPSLPIPSGSSKSTNNSNSNAASCQSLKLYPTREQLSAMDKFIDSMMLGDPNCEDSDEEEESNSEDGEREEANPARVNVRPERLPNPWIQRLFTCFRERGLHPSDSLLAGSSQTQTTSDNQTVWLHADNLPGLENLINKLEDSTSLGSRKLIDARRDLIDTLVPLTPVVKEDEGEKGASTAKRRRLMAAELFGLNTDGSLGSAHNSTSSSVETTSVKANESFLPASQIADVSSIDPVGDFVKLIDQGRIDYASDRLQARIIQFVTDPYTASLLRPKAVGCLAAYRKMAIQRAKKNNTSDAAVAKSYNVFIRSWREDLDLRGLIRRPSDPATHTDDDPRLSFWNEVIIQGYGLISNDEVPDIGVTPTEASDFITPKKEEEEEATTNRSDMNKTTEPSSKDQDIDELLDEME
ncbi:unnamed protein product [Calicophoron daubneyi]|uniref:Ku domain-containing protein n=1 Tax=Calicophoron daubneyi TaxID=300641 RepID=A0AAV2TBI0_CALDB